MLKNKNRRLPQAGAKFKKPRPTHEEITSNDFGTATSPPSLGPGFTAAKAREAHQHGTRDPAPGGQEAEKNAAPAG